MICPYCGQEHPDNFQFCPMFGERIVPRFKACINKQCPDYGKYILPLDSRFCPSCGKPLNNQIVESETANDSLEFTVEGVSFNMILVEHGSFMMGATPEMSNLYNDENPVHQVTLTCDYYIGKYEVTQKLWQVVMGSNPSWFTGDNLPIESVSWQDCQKFIRKLNSITGRRFRLPSEAEWEYAARGGRKSHGTKYSGGSDILDVAWYESNSGNRTHDVGTKQPNELGIYDMTGNVWEWCQDWYGNYSSSYQTNPTGCASGSYRVCRGGSWGISARCCHSSSRSYEAPDGRFYVLGLRLVLSE